MDTCAPETGTDCRPPKTPLESRTQIPAETAQDLALTFKTLANATRLRLLHALVRGGEVCVTDLSEIVGLKPQAVSNQLQRLRDRGIVVHRRDGLHAYYRVLDPCVAALLDFGWCLAEDTVSQQAAPRAESVAS